MALALAGKGKLGEGQTEATTQRLFGKPSPGLRDALTELGFGGFSIVDELDQIRTVFLIIDSMLVGGISLVGNFVWDCDDDHVDPRTDARDRNHEGHWRRGS
jgi:hypothetical protein